MSETLVIDLPRIYKEREIPEFEEGYQEIEKILVQIKLQELAAKRLIRLASGKRVKVEMPPEFPGKPLSEYLREIRE